MNIRLSPKVKDCETHAQSHGCAGCRQGIRAGFLQAFSKAEMVGPLAICSRCASASRLSLHRSQFIATQIEEVEAPTTRKTEDRFGDSRTGSPDIRREHDPLPGLLTVYPGFFNGIDVMTRTRELQFIAFETLVQVLDSFGVDTSDLKQQRADVLNVNVLELQRRRVQ